MTPGMEKQMEDRMIADLPWLSPIGALLLGAVVAVVLALVLPRGRQGLVGAWVAGAHLAAAGLAAAVRLDRGFKAVMEGAVVVDGLSLVLWALLGVAGAIAVALARPTVAGTDREGEFYAMLAASTLAAAVLGAAADAALLAIALGLSSLATFVMTGYLRRSTRGNEASLTRRRSSRCTSGRPTPTTARRCPSPPTSRCSPSSPASSPSPASCRSCSPTGP